MEVLIDLFSVCTGLTLIQRNAIKESGVFFHKMSEATVKSTDKIQVACVKLFLVSRSKEWREDYNKDKLDSFLTMRSQKK